MTRKRVDFNNKIPSGAERFFRNIISKVWVTLYCKKESLTKNQLDPSDRTFTNMNIRELRAYSKKQDRFRNPPDGCIIKETKDSYILLTPSPFRLVLTITSLLTLLVFPIYYGLTSKATQQKGIINGWMDAVAYETSYMESLLFGTAVKEKDGEILFAESPPHDPFGLRKDLASALSVAAKKNLNAVAVIIGNKDYSKHHRDNPDVLFAHNDAQMMKAYITKTLGYDERNIIYLQDATLANLVATFGTVLNPNGKLASYLKGGKSDVFIYYSGHGVPGLNDSRGYLLPVDADPTSAELNGYALETLYANLAKLPARSITVALDACFSGSSDGGAIVKNASPVMLRISEHKALLPKAVILTAAGNNEVASWDRDAQLGLFTRYLAEGVGGKADANKDNKVTLSELKNYLSEEVPYQARRRYGREQHPQVSGAGKLIMATTAGVM